MEYLDKAGMDNTNPTVIEKITKKKTYWTERSNKNVEVGSINEQKDMIIERYEEMLNFLKGVQIKNEEDLVYIKKPLDDLESNLKYIPNGPLFNDVIPTEMKDTILSYLCHSSAFMAACVCQEWKTVLDNRFKEKGVRIGEECSKCEDNGCVKAEEMMRAAADHKIDVHLVICHPVTEIDTELITDSLTSVQKFTITNHDNNLYQPILSMDQFEHLFESFEKGDNILEEVKLIELDFEDFNQERLANFLVTNIKRLTLKYVVDLDVETFMTQLQQDSANIKLTHLTLFCDFSQYPDNVADALCKVENVKLCDHEYVSVTDDVIKRFMENILQMTIVMKTLIIEMDIDIDNSVPEFGSLISPHDLKTVFRKMATLHLEGVFTLEQLEAVRSLPDVEVSRVQDYQEFFHHHCQEGLKWNILISLDILKILNCFENKLL